MTQHLKPPPVGEWFAGGFHVEKNPISGGFVLVEPARGRKESLKSKIRTHLMKPGSKKTFYGANDGSELLLLGINLRRRHNKKKNWEKFPIRPDTDPTSPRIIQICFQNYLKNAGVSDQIKK